MPAFSYQMPTATDNRITGGVRRDARIIWILFICLFVAIIYGNFATLSRIVRAPGAVVPAARMQIVQNLEGGIIAEIPVRAGDHVWAGEPILRLDRTRFAARVGELDQQIAALRLRRSRIEAELAEVKEVTIPQELLLSHEALAAAERALFIARRAAYLFAERCGT